MANLKEKIFWCRAYQWLRQICHSNSNVCSFQCDSLLQWPGTRTIAKSVWTKFGKSMLLIWTAAWGMLTRRKTFWFCLCTHPTEKQKYFLSKSTTIKKKPTLLSLNGIATHAGYWLVLTIKFGLPVYLSNNLSNPIRPSDLDVQLSLWGSQPSLLYFYAWRAFLSSISNCDF